MIVTIHRGAHTIGGSCIEISYRRERIILDIGAPLMKPGGGEIAPADLEAPSVLNEVVPDVPGLYKDRHPEVSAVFISHAHMDHYGLLDHVHPDIPVYLGQETKALLEIGRIFFPVQNKVYFSNLRTFEHWEPIKVGPFTVSSYLMGHSAFGASAFLIQAGEKKVFYTGDFRGHGRKAILIKNLERRPIKDLDCILMEGTTLGGKHKLGFDTEDQVENGFADAFRHQKNIAFVMASGSNVDRLVSLYRATKKTGKMLVLDLYSYYLMFRLKNLRKTSGLPPHPNDHIRIYYIKGHCDSIVQHLGKELLYKFKPRKIELDEIIENRANIVVKLPLSTMRRIAIRLKKEKDLENAQYLFSMWQGYIEKDMKHQAFCHEFDLPIKHIHVSGHAYLNDLQAFDTALKPKQVVPIHTLSGDKFDEFFENVKRVDDGASFKV